MGPGAQFLCCTLCNPGGRHDSECTETPQLILSQIKGHVDEEEPTPKGQNILFHQGNAKSTHKSLQINLDSWISLILGDC